MLSIFDDLCTINEIQSLSQRLEVARMLREEIRITKLKRKQVQVQPLSHVSNAA